MQQRREGQPFWLCWRWANTMKENLSFVIRSAFLERVPKDHLRKKNRTDEALIRLCLTEIDLVKYMERVPIEKIVLEANYVRFTIHVVHNGQPLRVTFSAEGHAKSNNIYFWVLAIQPLR